MKKKLIIGVILIICILIVAATIAKTVVENNLEALSEMAIQNVDLAKISDGVYTGSYSAFPISVEVEVTVKNHQISNIDLVKHFNGQGTSAEVIPDHVIKAQT